MTKLSWKIVGLDWRENDGVNWEVTTALQCQMLHRNLADANWRQVVDVDGDGVHRIDCGLGWEIPRRDLLTPLIRFSSLVFSLNFLSVF